MSRFDHVKYDQQASDAQKALKEQFEKLEFLIESNMPKGRAQTLALTKLEEVYMWCGKGIRDWQIVRNGSAKLQEERKNG